MPIATPQQFRQMLDAAQDGGYAYPAINVTSIISLNAAMKGFADSNSDGIIQFSTGAGQFASGLANKDAAFGCIVLGEAAHRLAEQVQRPRSPEHRPLPTRQGGGLPEATHRSHRPATRPGREQPLPEPHAGRVCPVSGRQHENLAGIPPALRGE